VIRKVYPDHLYENAIGFNLILNFLETMSAIEYMYICQSQIRAHPKSGYLL